MLSGTQRYLPSGIDFGANRLIGGPDREVESIPEDLLLLVVYRHVNWILSFRKDIVSGLGNGQRNKFARVYSGNTNSSQSNNKQNGIGRGKRHCDFCRSQYGYWNANVALGEMKQSARPGPAILV